jgi:hypothetical protein
VLACWRVVDKSGQQVVAPFHTHRRQPANFSVIDYRLHNPVFAWHLIISLRNPRHPVLQPFRERKELSNFGISDRDACQGSELATKIAGWSRWPWLPGARTRPSASWPEPCWAWPAPGRRPMPAQHAAGQPPAE